VYQKEEEQKPDGNKKEESNSPIIKFMVDLYIPEGIFLVSFLT